MLIFVIFISSSMNRSLFNLKLGTIQTVFIEFKVLSRCDNFAKDNDLYLRSLIPAYIRLLDVKPKATSNTVYRTYNPEKVCENNAWVCKGDIFLSKCGITTTTC